LNPQDLDALAPLYAIDALDGDDLLRFSEALKESESLRTRVRDDREAAASLALALEPIAPSPAAKAKLLDAVTPPAQRSAPIFTRVFWAVAALFLISLLVRSLISPVEPESLALEGDKPAPAAKGRIVWRGRSVELTVTGLPALPPDKKYQLWHLGPGPRPIPAATFSIDATGTLRGWDTLKFAVTKGDKFVVTLEPAEGSLSATMPLYVVPGR
jgi:anti-sigma-K factor RskA